MLYFLIHVSVLNPSSKKNQYCFEVTWQSKKMFEIKLTKYSLINEHIFNRINNWWHYYFLFWAECDCIKVQRQKIFSDLLAIQPVPCCYWQCPCRQAAVKYLAILLNSVIAGHLRMLIYKERHTLAKTQKYCQNPQTPLFHLYAF